MLYHPVRAMLKSYAIRGPLDLYFIRYKKDYVLQDESLLEIVLFGKIDVISWLLMSIAKD